MLKKIILNSDKFIFFLKYFMPFLGLNTRKESSLAEISQAIHTEILSVATKLLSGLVLSAVIIYSLISIGGVVHNYTLTLEYGQVIVLIVHSLIALTCVCLMSYIFRTQSKNKVLEEPRGVKDLSNLPFGAIEQLDFNKIAQSFFKGLAEGYSEKKLKELQEPTYLRTKVL